MATRHASAVKAHRQTIKRNAHNRELRSTLRTSLKSIREAISAGEQDQAKGMLRDTYSVVDKLVAKGVIHDNTGSRYKSRLAKRLHG